MKQQSLKNMVLAAMFMAVAIDGNCAAGKTTLAARLQRSLSCTVIPMDHFFLRPEQRMPERIQTPGGNVDHERFLAQVLIPLREGSAFTYRPYDCHTGCFGDEIRVLSQGVTVIEGSYSCHPLLREHYDLRVFLSVNPDEQLKRIRKRNSVCEVAVFRDKWIPLEEAYFVHCNVRECCEIVIYG